MDSNHRHELEENDLQAFLANFGEWWQKHGNKTLTAILLVLVVILGFRLIRWQRAAALEAAWSDLETHQTPSGLVEVANRHGNRTVQLLARLQAADTLLREVVTPRSATVTEGQEPDTGTDLTPEQKLDVSAREYEAVRSSRHAPPIFRFNASLGLASVMEQRGQWDEARKIYEGLLTEAKGFDAITAQAQGRLAMLDVLPRPVTIAPDPTPTPTPSATESDLLKDLLPDVGGPSLLDPSAFPPGNDTPLETPVPSAPQPGNDAPTNQPADQPAEPSAGQ